MDIVEVFVAADSYHICIKSLSVRKTVFLQCVAFPFSQGVYDLGIAAFYGFDIKTYRTLHTVQVIVKTGLRCYESRGRYSEKIELLGECLLKEIFYSFDRNLCVMEVQVCMIGCGDCDCIHYRLLLMIFGLIAIPAIHVLHS